MVGYLILQQSRVYWEKSMLKSMLVNSLAPGRFEQNLKKVIFQLISVTDGWGIFRKIALRSMPLDLSDDNSALVQLMAWCRQATSHYLSQCWPTILSPYGVTRPQWVNSSPSKLNGRHFADVFKCLNEKFCILITISLKFVPKCPIANKWTLVQVMAWFRTGDKPLSEPMLTQFTDAYMQR